MDRALLLQHLAQARRRLADGKRQVERQRQIILMLRGCGRDITEAQALLERFTEAQALYLQKLLSVRVEVASRQREGEVETRMTQRLRR